MEASVPAPLRSPNVRLVATLATLLLLALSSGTAASVYVAGDAPRRVASLPPSPPFELEAYRTRDQIRAAIDSLVAPLGAAIPLDDRSYRRIVALSVGRGRNPFIDTRGVSQPQDATDLELFRRFARAQTLPPLWGYRAGAEVKLPVHHLANRDAQPLRVLFALNAAAADSALVRGDVQTAMVRARENVSATRHYLDQPVPIDLLVGRSLGIRGARLLQRVALEAGEPATVTKAKQLEALLKRSFAAQPLYSRLYRYGRDAESSSLLALASDRTVHPALRLSTLEGAVNGACLNTREMLFGAARERHHLLDELARAISDIPRAAELLPAARRSLMYFDTGSADSLASAGVPGKLLVARNVMEQVVPQAVRARAAYCRSAL
jgi:hypothetical protein